MINDDVLIKFSRKRGYKYSWPDQVNLMKTRIHEIKLGFPGIGNDHLTLIECRDLKINDIFIYDQYIESPRDGDEAPLMLRILPESCLIEGIGCGIDSIRDPDRLNFRWKDIIQLPQLPPDFLVLRVDARPTMNGGPGYYYFYKSYRHYRI